MPADIRSFFGGKGGAAPAKPAASKKENEPVKKATKTRSSKLRVLLASKLDVADHYTKARVVLDDSDDEPVAALVLPKHNLAR